MKNFVYAIILLGLITLVLFLQGDLKSFIDLPSLITTAFLTIGAMCAKYGMLAFTFYQLDSVERIQIAWDGFLISILCGFLGTLISLIIMLRNLSNQAAIGPAMAVAFVSTFYSLVIALVVFFPATRMRASK